MGEDNVGNEVEGKLIPTTTSHKSVKNPQAKLWGSPLLLQGVRPCSMEAVCRKKKSLTIFVEYPLRIKIKHPLFQIPQERNLC